MTRRWTRRRRLAGAAVTVAGLALVTACSGDPKAVVTVTSQVTVGSSGTAAPASSSSAAAPSTSKAGTTTAPSKPPSTTASAAPSTPADTSGIAPGAVDLPQYATPAGQVVKVEPDGFKVTKLPTGAKPPQFVVVSFDGVGWHEKWQYWKDIQTQVPFHFTGFLSGTYMLSSATKDKYQGPGHSVGRSDISWNEPADLPVEISDLNDALNKGDEIGSHMNGHFCGPNGGNDWDTADWNNELDQFFSFIKNVDANNGISDKLNLTAADIKGERTPCLEGTKADLYPALKAHGMTYDSSFTKAGIKWPVTDDATGIWEIGMAEYPIHGTLPSTSPVDAAERKNHKQITMDYNFWYSQNGVTTGTPEQSAQDSQQVLDTYRDMYNAAFEGNRAPLILGNHFNNWNNGAYSDAIANFVKETCGKPDTYCVPFRDLISWMEAQDPAVLLQLQKQGPEVGAGQ
jgi:hypothetical protein